MKKIVPACILTALLLCACTADFSATLTAYDTDNASSATLSVVLYSDAAHATEVTRDSVTLSVLGSSADITVSGLTENTTYYAVLESVDSEGVAGDPVDLGSFTTIWDEDVWTYYPARGTLEKGWIVVSNVTANGTSLSVAANSNKGDAEIPALDFTGGIRDGYRLVAVGDSAFASCTALTNVVLPATVTTVGGDAFRYDTALLSFAAPGPVTKNVMTKSSIESVNARSPPAIIPGRSIGSVTLKNAYIGDAPRSYAASITRSSKSWRRASTVMVTYDTQNVTCAMKMVPIPQPTPTAVNIISSEMPISISGMTSGV